MDPNEVLRLLREIVTEVNRNGVGDIRKKDLQDLVVYLSDLITNLDTWIVNGGFLPADWNIPSYSSQISAKR